MKSLSCSLKGTASESNLQAQTYHSEKNQTALTPRIGSAGRTSSRAAIVWSLQRAQCLHTAPPPSGPDTKSFTAVFQSCRVALTAVSRCRLPVSYRVVDLGTTIQPNGRLPSPSPLFSSLPPFFAYIGGLLPRTHHRFCPEAAFARRKERSSVLSRSSRQQRISTCCCVHSPRCGGVVVPPPPPSSGHILPLIIIVVAVVSLKQLVWWCF